MKTFSKFAVYLAITIAVQHAFAQESTNPQSDGPKMQTEAKITVAPPKYVFGYNRYMYDMDGNKAAATGIYKFGHSSVDLQMYSATWLYSPKWTFVAIAPYIKNRIETIYEPGKLNMKTTDVTEGLGDLRLMGTSPLWISGPHLVMYDIGVTLPTGSIDEKFSSNPKQRASYNMQPGSGTPDLVVGTTYTHTLKSLVSGARGQATIRGGKNAEGWNLGNEVQATVSSKYQFNPYANLGLVGTLKSREKINGRDAKYELANNYKDPATGVSGDGHQYYHEAQTTIDATVVGKLQSPAWKGISGSLEAGYPLWQHFINKDNVDLPVNYWVAGAVTALF